MMRTLFIALLFVLPLAAEEDVVKMGSGPAGMTAAIYAARSGLSTLLIEGDETGGQITLSYKVDNFPGFPGGISGEDLVNNMREQATKFGARIQSAKIVSVDVKKRPFVIKLESGKEISAKALIIASGASTRWLGIPSEAPLIGKGVNSCAVCDAPFFKDKEVIVVGGGDAALEDAIYLANYASKVTVIHRRDRLRASQYLQDQVNSNKKIGFLWNSVIKEIKDPVNEKVTGVILEDVQTGNDQFFPCDGIFVAIGHAPNTELFKGQLELDETGYIRTKPFTTETDIEGIFAAGDVADPKYRQAITAAGSGSMAAIDAYKFIKEKRGKL